LYVLEIVFLQPEKRNWCSFFFDLIIMAKVKFTKEIYTSGLSK